MDLSQAWARWATRRVHVLLVAVPGWEEVRIRVERELDERAWPVALSPAEADVLVVCGHAAGGLADAVDRVWAQLPGPRARTVVRSREDISAALDTAVSELRDDEHQRHDALARPNRVDGDRVDRGERGGENRHEAQDAGHDGHGGDRSEHEDDHDAVHHGHDMPEHGGHDMPGHGGHDMPGPGGIPLAGGGPDRDQLDLDVLHVPIGPVMPHWPAGLVLHCSMQGDVVVAAEAEVVGGEVPRPGVAGRDAAPSGGPRWTAIQRCDAIGRLLTVAGWESAARRAREVRNALLDGAPPETSAAPLSRLERRVRRSRMLRWSLRGVPSLSAPGAEQYDVLEQLQRWLTEARRAVEGLPVAPTPAASPASVSAMVTGLELASVRLAVAGSDIDTTAAARSHAHG